VQYTLSSNDDKACSLIVDTIKRSLLFFDVELPSIFKQYLTSLIQESFLLVKHYFNYIEAKDIIPMRLWSHNGGSVWARILSKLSRKHGGHVTGFDHAGGVGFFKDALHYGHRELENCDAFVTYSERQSQYLQNVFPRNTLVYSEFPEILHVNDLIFKASFSRRRCKSRSHKPRFPKTVMYVPTIYPGERVGVNGGLMSDRTLLDWEVRLLTKLEEWGYKVILKAHPEGYRSVPLRLEELFGPIVSVEPFEQVIDRADVLLLDMPASTTFTSSVLSDKPIVLMDFGFNEIEDAAKELLSLRCAVVSCWFDADNRAMTHWSDLSEAITACGKKADNEFAKQYYNLSL